MFTTKPKMLTLTLVFYVALALALATTSEAKDYSPVPLQRRDHANLNRLIKKRSPYPQNPAGLLAGQQNGPVNNAGNDPPASPSAGNGSPTAASPSSPPVPSAPPANSAASATSNTASKSSSSSTSSSPTSSATSGISQSSSSSTSSTSSSSSTSSVQLKTTAPSTPTQGPVTTPAAQDGNGDSIVTLTSSAVPSASASSAPSTSSAAKITRTTLTVIIGIAASIGGVAVIWTAIRKWKFKPSSSFEDRMQPIDWQPTTEDSGLPTHRRGNSNASSFHSGSGHGDEGMTGRGAFGSASDHGHGATSLAPLPDHDFTAGSANLAPVGGYADLTRGPSPQPQMHEPLVRGPSLTRANYDQYGVPLHHQGGYANEAYDYNGAPRY